MTKISKLPAYPLKEIPGPLDFMVGTEKETGDTRSFDIQGILNAINSLNGSEIISYTFAISPIDDLEENGSGYFLSEDNIVVPEDITELKFSKKTRSGIDVSLFLNFIDSHKNTFTVQLRNLSDPNNFVYLNILEITEEDFQFVMSVSVYASDVYIGSLLDKNVYVLEFNIKADTDVLGKKLDGLDTTISGPITMDSTVLQAFGSLQKQATDLFSAVSSKLEKGGYTGDAEDLKDDIDQNAENISLKLDKGGYSGNAQDLKTDIDNIYQPDVLISSIPPTRSVNTFTYPANQYTALISKTIRTNPVQFVTTIDVAATDYKRVDLIYFKSDNTLAKIIGTESLTVAIRPDVPLNSVAISFINVFGNIISDPTPVTNEISFQDYFGAEKFKVAEDGYVRFKGATLEASTKSVIIDPLVPLSAFLDIVNGNDTMALLENANKPFKTLNALFNAMPTTTGEIYTIYITGGTVPVTRRLPIRSINWIAYTPTTLDFTNCLENDGITNAAQVLIWASNTTYIWNFPSSNISIISNYVGTKHLNVLNNKTPVMTGTIDTFNWKSLSAPGAGSLYLNNGSNLTINNLYDSPQAQPQILSGATDYDLLLKNINVQYGRQLNNTSRCIIKNITKVGVGTFTFTLANAANTTSDITIGNVSLDGCTLQVGSQTTTFKGTVSPTCLVDLVGVNLVSGELKSTLYAKNVNVNNQQVYRNFIGKLNNITVENGRVTFENSQIQVDTNLIQKGVPNPGLEKNDIVIFKGLNTIIQNTTSSDLFISSASSSLVDKTILLEDQGFIKTNANTYGKVVTYINTASTFKEKVKERVVRSKIDLINRVLLSDVTYIIDGNITLLTGEYIEIPAGGLTINGYGFTPSSISKNVSGQSIFTSALGGSGDFVSINITYYPGVGSTFNITDINGTHAIELDKVNFQGVTGSSLGTFNGYRQFTGTTCGFYSLSDGIVLEGNWSGFKLTNSNIIGFGSTGTLFKKGVSTVFSNRFYIDINIQIATGSKICDFADANFTNDKSLQVVNCYAKVNGVINDGTTVNTFPNITPYSSKSYFVNNIGIKNSNNMPYGISTINLQTYTNDADAAAGGIVQVGETYIETATGYFKKRLT